MSNRIGLSKGRWIDTAHCQVSFVRSSGPGGQNVNKVATKVQLALPLTQLEQTLQPTEYTRILDKLSHKITSAQQIMIACDETRSQKRNLEIACKRLSHILRDALIVPKKRRVTRPTRASQRRRLDQKKQQSEKKQARTQKWDVDA